MTTGSVAGDRLARDLLAVPRLADDVGVPRVLGRFRESRGGSHAGPIIVRQARTTAPRAAAQTRPGRQRRDQRAGALDEVEPPARSVAVTCLISPPRQSALSSGALTASPCDLVTTNARIHAWRQNSLRGR